jgi:anti-sigma B factor antagonist
MFWTSQSDYYGVPVVGLHGELDAKAQAHALYMLGSVIADHPRVIIDLGKLEFCDSSGLRVLLRLRKKCDTRGGWLILCEPRGAVARLLYLMQMDQHFIIWEDAP